MCHYLFRYVSCKYSTHRVKCYICMYLYSVVFPKCQSNNCVCIHAHVCMFGVYLWGIFVEMNHLIKVCGQETCSTWTLSSLIELQGVQNHLQYVRSGGWGVAMTSWRLDCRHWSSLVVLTTPQSISPVYEETNVFMPLLFYCFAAAALWNVCVCVSAAGVLWSLCT